METFITDLEALLIRTARHEAAIGIQPPARRRRDAAARRGQLAAGLAVAATVLVTLTVLLSGDDTTADAHGLPALANATTDISDRSRALGSVAHGMDLRHAHTFRTPSGTGYVLATPDKRSVCLVLPDPPAGYGSSCATVERVRQEGLVGQLISPDPDAGFSQVAVLLPADAPAPVVHDDDGDEHRLSVTDGVAVTSVTTPGVLTITTPAGSRRLTVRPYEPQGKLFLECADGRIVQVPTFKDAAVGRREAICGR